MTKPARGNIRILSFKEVVAAKPVNLFEGSDGKRGDGYAITPLFSFQAPAYRSKELVGAWMQGYLTGLASEESIDDVADRIIDN